MSFGGIVPETTGLVLEANYPRSELRREGHEALKVGRSLMGAAWDGSKYLPGGTLGVKDSGEPDPEGVWQEPETGFLFLRPCPLRSDWLTNEAFTGSRIGLSEFYASPSLVEGGIPASEFTPRFLTTKRTPVTAPIVPLATPAAYAGLPLGNGVWVASTKDPLAPNEGFSVVLQPSGTAWEVDGIRLAVAFGGRWAIYLSARGVVYVWAKIGDGWRQVQSAELRGGGANQSAPTQITVIPWGIDCISILSSEASADAGQASGSTQTGSKSSLLLRTRQLGIEPTWDDARKMWIKSPGAPLAFAVPPKDQTSMAIGRVIYAPATVRFAPEAISEPMPNTEPVVHPIGYFGQNHGGGAGASVEMLPVKAEDNTAWNQAIHTRAVGELNMAPSALGRYSPEVWAMRYAWEPELEVSPDRTRDLTLKWRLLSWLETADPRPTVMKVLLTDDEPQRRWSIDGSLRLKIGDDTVWEGTVAAHRRVPEGGLQIQTDMIGDFARTAPLITDDVQAEDLWMIMEQTPAGNLDSFSAATLGSILRKLFKRVGAGPSEIDVDAELDDILVDGFDAASDDWKLANDDATIADVVRALHDQYGLQGREGVRVRRENGIWRAWLPPAWDAESGELDGIFYLDSECLTAGSRADAVRWALDPPWLKIAGGIIWTVSRPRFNAIRAYGHSATGSGGQSYAAHIAPDPTGFDALSRDHDPRCSPRVSPPGEGALASSRIGLARLARRTHERDGVIERLMEFSGEWQPFMRPGQTWAVVGRAPADGDGDIALGDVVSYGAFRVDEVQPEIRRGTLRREWSARYTLRLLGSTDLEWAPMFDGS